MTVFNPLQPYTLSSRSKQPHKPKLTKEYGCPNALGKECTDIQQSVSHWEIMKMNEYKKHYSGLKVRCFEMPNTSYTER